MEGTGQGRNINPPLTLPGLFVSKPAPIERR